MSGDNCCDPSGVSCEAMLCELMQAYTRLISGTNVVEVRFGDDATKYSEGNKGELLNRLRSLHQTCGNEASAALLGMGRRRAPARVCFGESYPCGSGGGCH